VERTAVGIQTHSIPQAEIIGEATVKEHLPKPEISLMATSLFCFSIKSFLKIYCKILTWFNIIALPFI
jgi:hypothetical protein